MKTKAVRLYGENDLRLEEFELPQLTKRQNRVQNICEFPITLQKTLLS